MPETPESKPAAKPKGGLWTALTNLSIGRTGGDKADKQADIVHKGETVTLTDEQAHGFLHGHRRPVIQAASDSDDATPNVQAKDLFGQRPPAEAFGARPDPPGSSKVTVNDEVADPADPRNAPEAKDPKTDFSVDPAAAKDKGTGVKAK